MCLFVKWMREYGYIGPIDGLDMQNMGKTLDELLHEFEDWLRAKGHIKKGGA